MPKRASLFDKLADDETIFDPDEENLEAADEDDSSLTVEQAAVKTKASPAVTALRYIVLVIAMFVIGGLIWIVVERASDSASAAGISLALTSLESVLI